MFNDSPMIRRVIYALAIASNVASFFVILVSPELAVAFVSTSTLLTGVAGSTALSNVTQPTDS